MVGMPDVAVRESRERIKSAMINSGFGYPNKTVTINLAPANVRKEGAGFDLPVAMGILGAMGVVKGLDRHLLAGELSLDGAIRPIRGALSMAVCARTQGIPNLILPAENAAEAAVVEGVSVYGVRHLAEVVALLNAAGGVHAGCGQRQWARTPIVHRSGFPRRARPDHGQAGARSGGGRRAQRPDDRAARVGQDACWPSGWPAFCRR